MATKALVSGNQADAECARDLLAYKSMVQQGLEPPNVTGAWELQQKAKTKYDIEGTHPIDEALK